MILDPKTDLDEIKNALKIDTDDDDVEVSRAAQAAIAYIRGAIGMISPLFISKKMTRLI